MEKKNNPAKESGTTRLPEELRAELRKAQSRYGSEGKAAPSFGALLLEAWWCYVEAQKNAVQSSQNSLPVKSSHLDRYGLDRTHGTSQNQTIDVLGDLIGEIAAKAQQVLHGLQDLEQMVRGGQGDGGSGEDPRARQAQDPIAAAEAWLRDSEGIKAGTHETKARTQKPQKRVG